MFKYEYMTMTQIGKLFGVSSHVIGKWLVEIGLRNEAMTPSTLAFDGRYVIEVPTRNERYNWDWHSERTVAALEKAGHRRIYNPPPYLAEPARLNGPFTLRANNANGFDVVNGDGTCTMVIAGDPSAEFAAWLFNAANERGVVDRHLALPS